LKIKILCTLGPASLKPDVIASLDARGVDLFRINLSHTRPDEVEALIDLIDNHSSAPICLDTQGAQIRCGNMAPDVVIDEDSEVVLTSYPLCGTERQIPLWPEAIFDVLEPGMEMSIDFDSAVVQVTDVCEDHARAVVLRGGQVRSNKAVTVTPAIGLPALSDDDRAAVEIGRRRGIEHYALSFAGSSDDVAELRALAPEGAHIIAKIESRTGVSNMDSIIHAADAVLVDRGDLSREVPIERVPYFQKSIVRRANRWNRPVYVATNLLESMVTNRLPTIAEANDVANTLLDGVHGLVLAAETAVGCDPVGAVDMVLRAVRAFEHSTDAQLLDDAAPVAV
jgi:sulfate adenylyltransferase